MRNLPWAYDEGANCFLLSVDPLGEPVLSGLDRSIQGVRNGELVAKIY